MVLLLQHTGLERLQQLLLSEETPGFMGPEIVLFVRSVLENQ